MRNPIDAIGIWWTRLPFWRQFVLLILLPEVVFCVWLAYQFRRGWFGPLDEH
jgi:hypothetical protein